MNLLLLRSSQINGNQAEVTGRQLEHLRKIHQLDEGSSVRVGEMNGLMGTGIVKSINQDLAVLAIELDTPPPPPLPLTLIMAMPRPKMLRRCLQSVSAMGIKDIYLINSKRVEKSFWQTPFLDKQAIENELILGLEQAQDTIMPNVYQKKLFKPFVEDELGELISGTTALVGHPKGTESCPINIKEPTSLVVGPEGGFIPYEIEKLHEVGVKAVTLGPRILRVETAIPALISRLFPS
jgi:16S rRNA (uracil1498-N3)-methyltransferase